MSYPVLVNLCHPNVLHKLEVFRLNSFMGVLSGRAGHQPSGDCLLDDAHSHSTKVKKKKLRGRSIQFMLIIMPLKYPNPSE